MKNRKTPLTILVFLLITFYVSANTGDPIKIIRADQTLMLHSNNKITFDLGSTQLNETAIYDLSIISRTLKQNPELQIEIAVHNDSRSNMDLSLKLTQERAEAIKEFFVRRGISPDNLIAKGYGDSQILNKCKPLVKCSNAEHNYNKRVELRIVNPEKLESYTFVFPKKNKTLAVR